MTVSETTPKAKAAPAAQATGSETPAPKTANGVGAIKYVGGAGVRVIEAKDWKANGVEGQNSVRWDSANNYSLPGDQLSDAAVALLKPLSEFKIVSE